MATAPHGAAFSPMLQMKSRPRKAKPLTQAGTWEAAEGHLKPGLPATKPPPRVRLSFQESWVPTTRGFLLGSGARQGVCVKMEVVEYQLFKDMGLVN